MPQLTPIDTQGLSFFARQGLASGAIRRQDGQAGSYGVLFLGSSAFADPFSFGTEYLTGVLLEHSSLPAADSDRYFTIVGGYYLQKNAALGLRTIRVFGVAADPALGFSLSEGGSSTLAGAWEPVGGGSLDEAQFAQDEDPASTGWTFIVQEAKVPARFPAGGQPLSLLAVCPTITNVVQTKQIIDADSQIVTLTIETEGPAPETYVFMWGDGSETDIVSTPSFSHTYQRPISGLPYYSANVLARRQGSFCEAQFFNIKIYFEDPCPQLEGIEASYGQPGETEQEIAFQAILSGPAPDAYQWYVDGVLQAETGPAMTVIFARPEGDSEPHLVRVKALGPGDCQAELSIEVRIPGRCPVLTALLLEQTQLAPGTSTFDFRAQFSGPAPDRFFWTLGGSTLETSGPLLSHSLPRLVGQAQELSVSVYATGPDSCQTETKSLIINIPAYECPVLESLEALLVSEGEAAVEYALTATVSGPQPETFHWTVGGTSVQTAAPTYNVQLPRLVGQAQELSVSVYATGPDSCQTETKSLIINIPAYECPVLESLEALLVSEGEAAVEYALTATVSGPQPETFHWTVGGTSVQTAAPTYNVQLPRLVGQAQEVLVKVYATGPGDCQTGEVSLTLTIPAYECPVLESLELKRVELGETEARFELEALVAGPAPTRYTWQVGGQAFETEVPRLEYAAPRPFGDAITLSASVFASGPEGCLTGTVEISFPLPGICPQISAVEASALPPLDDKQEIRFLVRTEKSSPASYTWNWGDGSPLETLAQPEATHIFTRQPGDTATLKVVVSISGPGSCVSEKEVFVQVPGLCPEVQSFVLALGATTEEDQTVLATLSLAKAEGSRYRWNWGDGSAEESTQLPVATHVYARQPGDPRIYAVSVRVEGPGACSTASGGSISIPGICPEITGMELQYAAPQEQSQIVTATAQLGRVPASSYTWSWGDGSPDTSTSQPVATHAYARQPGNAARYAVSVRASGPGACQASGSAEAAIPGICPQLAALRPSIVSTDAEGQRLAFEVEVKNTPAAAFRWSWGDGSPDEITTAPAATHLFARAPGEDREYLVRVQAEGPGDCASTVSVQVRVPGICPQLKDIDIQVISTTESAYEVEVRLSLEQGQPLKYTWSWGDQSPAETTSAPLARHSYLRRLGDARLYLATVEAEGPGNCRSSSRFSLSVPGICPKVISLEIFPEPAADYATQALRARATLDHPEGLSYHWNWGDGATSLSTQPEASHTYARQPGDARSYLLTLTLSGPEHCESSSVIPVIIEGYCPEWEKQELSLGELKDDTQEISLALSFAKGVPDQIFWNWGDGSPEEASAGSVTMLSHRYRRQPGGTRSYPLRVKTRGPGSACQLEHERMVQIPGVCPEAVSLDIVKTEDLSETEQQVFVSLTVARTPADKYRWNWGDGSPITETVVPEASHIYQRQPGDPATYTLEVTLEGPGPCSSQIGRPHQVPGLCPRPAALLVTREAPGECVQTIHATVEVELTPASEYAWNWGDGSPVETTATAWHSHDYVRQPGDDQLYALSVELRGPGSCAASISGSASVPGICPEITGVEARVIAQTLQAQQVSVEVAVARAVPTAYRWDWGDGSPVEEGDAPLREHSYLRYPGDPRSYTLTITTLGPGSSGACDRSTEYRHIVPGYCPEIGAVKIGSQPLPDEKLQVVEVSADIELAPAEAYLWNWGDGSPEETTLLPQASHAYERLPGAPRELSLSLTLLGPGQCRASRRHTVVIEGLCPRLLDWKATRVAEDADSVSWRVELAVEDADKIPAGLFRYEWHWGDGSEPLLTTEPYAVHQYARPAQDAVYKIDFQMLGPGACQRSGCVRVKVEGYCPLIEAVDPDYCTLADTYADVKVAIRFRAEPAPRSLPARYVWRWGDGSPDTVTSEPWAGHRYRRDSEQPLSYAGEVIASGGPCDCETRQVFKVELPGACPLITDIRVIYGPAEAGWQELTLAAVLRGGAPRIYEWHLGDGSLPVRGAFPSLTHRFARTQERYRVTLKIVGRADSYQGKNCMHSLEADIEIALAPALPG